ncbi:hypothetical protein AX15_004237 [Amanita polypyramis BW_CC]|nr:hypothetical protein AX15_004237 [Amanita polypyramis BW_CC]
MQPTILIVGAGPSGLILALTLLHHGIPVQIIDNGNRRRLGQWSSAIMPRSLELFTTLRIIDNILEQAIRFPAVRLYETPEQVEPHAEFELMPHVEPTPASPFRNTLLLTQDRLEKTLLAALARSGCTVEYGTELVSFQQFHDYVDVKLARKTYGEQILMHEDASYAWIVGTDEAAGVVCELLGLTFFGEAKTTYEVVIGDIYVEGLSKHWHVWGDPSTHHVGLKATGINGLFDFSLAGQNIDASKLCGDKALMKQTLQEFFDKRSDLEFGDILRSFIYSPHIRSVDKFVVGRVLIAGVGEQGMNTGIHDSCNLGWKLALVHKNLAPYSLLNSYAEERLPVAAGVIDQAASADPFMVKERRIDFLGRVGLNQLSISYRWSSIVFDERRRDARENAAEEDEYFHDYNFDGSDEEEEVLDAHGLQADGILVAGDRAPDAPGLIDMRKTTGRETWRLFEIFGPSYHTVLVFTEVTRRWTQVHKLVSAYPKGTVQFVLIARRGQVVPEVEATYADFVLEDSDGHSHNAYLLDDNYGIVVVRPDGVIGAIAKGAEGVGWYFEGIFAQRSPVHKISAD